MHIWPLTLSPTIDPTKKALLVCSLFYRRRRVFFNPAKLVLYFIGMWGVQCFCVKVGMFFGCYGQIPVGWVVSITQSIDASQYLPDGSVCWMLLGGYPTKLVLYLLYRPISNPRSWFRLLRKYFMGIWEHNHW